MYTFVTILTWTVVGIFFLFLLTLLRKYVLKCRCPHKDNSVYEVRITVAREVVEGGSIPVLVTAFNRRGREVAMPEGAMLEVLATDPEVGEVVFDEVEGYKFNALNPGMAAVVATLRQEGKDDIADTSDDIAVLVDNEVATIEVNLGE